MSSGQMRAPKNEATGTAGQSFVKGQFENLGWGALVNSEHDLGTDLWLMARDARRFDMKTMLVGAQVKSGPSYFSSPKKQKGEVIGWWFREEDDSHFEYWCDHAIPHILVLHRLTDNKSFWIQVKRERVVDTGKGRKIFVPAASGIDSAHFDALIALATSTSKAPSWEGSAWQVGEPIPQSSVLRYALVTPRLVAPHPNKGTDSALSPEEAVALLIQFRLRDLVGWDPEAPRFEIEDARKSPIWGWRLVAALYDWLTEGELGGFGHALIETAPDESSRVAATVCHAFALVERGKVSDALTLLEQRLAADEANPVDHGWLQTHLARCHFELGDAASARDLALETQVLRQIAPADPTALAVVAASGYMIFSLSDWGGRSIADMVQSNDTAATWWRSQTLASGLGKHFDETYRAWSGDKSTTFNAEDVAWGKLRSAMLLAGFSADGSGWRHSASLLARRELMSPAGDDSPEWAMDLLRFAGAKKELILASRRLLATGPVSALVNVGESIDLDQSTRTSLHADLAFIESAADVLSTADCDRFARWALSVLKQPQDLIARLNPQFLLEPAVLEMLRELVNCVTPDVREALMDHIVDLPTLDNDHQHLAHGYSRVMVRLGDFWLPRHVDAFSARPEGDNFELRDAIDQLLATGDEDFRSTLHERISKGDMRALGSYGNVTDLPRDVAAAAVAALSQAVLNQVEEAKKGADGLGGPEPLGALVLLNAWHPEVAEWSACETALGCPVSHPMHLQEGLRLLGRLVDRVPDDVRATLQQPLSDIADRLPADTFSFFGQADVRGTAAVALALLFPETVTDAWLRHLIHGTPAQRAASVDILVARQDSSQVNLLSILASDSDPDVRAEAAEGLATWCVQEIGLPDSAEVLQELLAEPGVDLGVRISRTLLSDEAKPVAVEMLAAMLQSHPSAVVRARLALVQRAAS
jgi:hypothetical protein